MGYDLSSIFVSGDKILSKEEAVEYRRGYRKMYIGEEGKEVEFKFRKMGALPTLMSFSKLISIVGPTIASVFDNDPETSFEDKMVITEAVVLLCNRIKEEDLPEIINSLFETATLDGEPVNLTEDFREFDEFIEVLVFVLQETYQKSFTKWLKDKGLNLRTLGHSTMETETQDTTSLEQKA
jgi:hypothetical protein